MLEPRNLAPDFKDTGYLGGIILCAAHMQTI